MKKMLFTLFAAAFVLTTHAAESKLRVDLNGLASKIEIAVKPEKGLWVTQGTWLKEKAKFFKIVIFSKKLTDKWEDFDFKFTPSASGEIALELKGDWAKNPKDLGWVCVSKITYEIENVKNSKKVRTGLRTCGKAKMFPKAGKDGTEAFVLNHNNPGIVKLQVEAGKTYEVEFEAKAAAEPSK